MDKESLERLVYNVRTGSLRSSSSSVADPNPDWIRIRSGLDPDSIKSLNPDLDSESRSRRAKMNHKNRKI